MASEEVKGSFCRYDSCVITDQLAIGVDALERELLIQHYHITSRCSNVCRG